MSDVTSCPSCRRPLVVPNPAKCACGAELGSGSRERTTPADPPPPQKKALLSIFLQGDESLALMKEYVEAGATLLFDLDTDMRSLRDSELGLPPGTLGRALAEKMGRPPEIFADVPQPVGVFIFCEKEPPADAEARVQTIARLCVLGRMAGASPATRAFLLHGCDRVLPVADFMSMTEPREGVQNIELAVWVQVLPGDRRLRTHGLAAVGFPEVELETGGEPTPEDVARFTDPLLTAGHQMMIRREALPDGFEIGEYKVRAADGVLRLLLPNASPKRSLWQRLFA